MNFSSAERTFVLVSLDERTYRIYSIKRRGLFKVLLFQMRPLFGGGVYLRAVLFKKIIAQICKRQQVANLDNKIMKYTHFELKNIVIQKNNFPTLV